MGLALAFCENQIILFNYCSDPFLMIFIKINLFEACLVLKHVRLDFSEIMAGSSQELNVYGCWAFYSFVCVVVKSFGCCLVLSGLSLSVWLMIPIADVSR